MVFHARACNGNSILRRGVRSSELDEYFDSFFFSAVVDLDRRADHARDSGEMSFFFVEFRARDIPDTPC